MKSWFLSRNGALTITALAWLSEMWRGYLDAMFVFPVDFNDPLILNAAAVIFALLFGGWAWSLALAWRGSRKAMITTFALNLLVLLGIPVSWLFFYCPAACQAEAGIFNLANTLNLAFGGIAAIALSFHLSRQASQ